MISNVSGDIPVVRRKIPADDRGVDETVRLMVEMARGIYGGKSPKIRALAINIINAAGVADKDYYGMAKAIHEWVRDNIRYVRDPVGQETLSHPEETAFNSQAGDCDDKTILEMALLASIGIKSYPVVVSTDPSGIFSHVYLHVVIPPGKHRFANAIIPADPIMREWPFGKEAGPHRVTRKKLYTNLLYQGIPMRASDVLEYDNLGAYATSPSYLDEENVASITPVLKKQFTPTAPERLHRVSNMVRDTDIIDSVMQPGEPARILARGPLTSGHIRKTTAALHTKHASFPVSDRLNWRPGVSLLDPATLKTVSEIKISNETLQRMNSGQKAPIVQAAENAAAAYFFNKRAEKLQRRADITNQTRDRAFAQDILRLRNIAIHQVNQAAQQDPRALDAARATVTTLKSTGSTLVGFLADALYGLENDEIPQSQAEFDALVDRLLTTFNTLGRIPYARVTIDTEKYYDPEKNQPYPYYILWYKRKVSILGPRKNTRVQTQTRFLEIQGIRHLPPGITRVPARISPPLPHLRNENVLGLLVNRNMFLTILAPLAEFLERNSFQ